MRAPVLLLLMAAPAMAQMDPVANPCAGARGEDICAVAQAAAGEIAATLPRQIAPGIMAMTAVQGGPQVQLDLNVAADLGLPGAAGFARLACAEPPLAALMAQGGQVAFLLRGRTLATVTTCEKAT